MEVARSRAAILPFAGDPFLLHYWLELYYKVWCGEVDHLYIVCSTQIEKPVLDYIEYLCTADPERITYVYDPLTIQHGDKILKGLLACKQEHIMLIEDDAYIFKAGQVDWCFKQLESGEYDIVGSKRGSCSDEITLKARAIWGTTVDGTGDQGCNFWPCYFFSTKSLLLSTDRNFNARAWVQGEKITPLQDYIVEVPQIVGDTFVNTSLQLRAMIPERRIMYVAQYHAHPDDLMHFETRAEYTPFDGHASWTHIGSLSSGVDGVIMDEFSRPLAKRKSAPEGPPTDLPNKPITEMEHMEWERRVQWFLTFWENRDPEEIKEFAEAYKKAIDQIIYQFRLRLKKIIQRQQIYKEALTL